jgi:hypothetical protein
MRQLVPDRIHPPVSFIDWWERTILTDQQGNTFSRADLVLSVAEQDGGTHIDAVVNEKYRQLTRENSLGLQESRDLPIANSVALASVRHMAEERLETIEDGISWDGDRRRSDVRHDDVGARDRLWVARPVPDPRG